MKFTKDFGTGNVTIESHPSKKIMFEKPAGLWKEEDYRGIYMDAYENKMITDIKAMGSWVKICDMREYKMSSVVECVQDHLKWCSSVGLKEIVFIYPETFLVQSQMKRSCKDIVDITNLSDEKEAWARAEEIAKSL